MNKTELAKFLVEAKKNTYATQKGKVNSSRKASKDLAYRKGDYFYLDSYFGRKDFSGEEIVYHKEIPIWGMNYYGKMFEDDLPEGFIETLREALVKVELKEPYRGCREYKRGEYLYSCDVDGSIDFYHGYEKIDYKGREVYRLYFHGGFIR
jgi:hypothetical protein